MSLLSRQYRETESRRRPKCFTPSLLPTVEGLESRVVLSQASAPALVQQIPDTLQDALNLNLQITDIDLINAAPNEAGNLVLTGTLSGVLGILGTEVPFENLPFELELLEDNDGCTILDLHLGEINLNLLGLTVNTSEICLTISDAPGTSGLLDLGNLLCGVGGTGSLLDQIDGILDLGGTVDDLGGVINDPALLSGLSGTLNGVIGELLPDTLGGLLDQFECEGNILHLELGPVDLTLLGLNVYLDDCEGGPVTVDVGFQSGPGALLGNLLCNLDDVLDDIDLDNLTGKCARSADKLLDTVLRGLDKIDLDNPEKAEKQLEKLADKVEKRLDKFVRDCL